MANVCACYTKRKIGKKCFTKHLTAYIVDITTKQPHLYYKQFSSLFEKTVFQPLTETDPYSSRILSERTACQEDKSGVAPSMSSCDEKSSMPLGNADSLTSSQSQSVVPTVQCKGSDKQTFATTNVETSLNLTMREASHEKYHEDSKDCGNFLATKEPTRTDPPAVCKGMISLGKSSTAQFPYLNCFEKDFAYFCNNSQPELQDSQDFLQQRLFHKLASCTHTPAASGDQLSTPTADLRNVTSKPHHVTGPDKISPELSTNISSQLMIPNADTNSFVGIHPFHSVGIPPIFSSLIGIQANLRWRNYCPITGNLQKGGSVSWCTMR